MLGLAVVVVGLVSPAAAGWIAVVVEPFGSLLAAIADWAAGIEAGTLAVPDGAAGGVLVTAALLLAAGLWRLLGPAAAGSVLALVLVAASILERPAPPPAAWIAAACDIGQGDAYLVRTGPGAAMLIDTGPEAAALLACLRQLRVTRIDLLLLTHYDTDHVAATAAVLGRFHPRLLVSPVEQPRANAAAVRAAAAEQRTPVAVAQPGQRLRIGEATMTVIWPRRLIRSGSVSNNAAVTIAVEAGGLRLLFTGDLEPLGQAGVMASYPPHRFDVTTIPHHGSANQHPRFLGWTGAGLAWVSAGRGNTFGHPRPEALHLAEQAGAVVGRTDEHGTIVVVRRAGRPALLALGKAP